MKDWNIEPGEMLLLVFLCSVVISSMLVLIWKLISYNMRVRSLQSIGALDRPASHEVLVEAGPPLPNADHHLHEEHEDGQPKTHRTLTFEKPVENVDATLDKN